MSETVHDPSSPVVVRRGQRFKIKTVKPPRDQRCKGQDATVVIVMDDGTELVCPNVMSASWRVDSRAGYCTGEFVVTGVEVEVDALLEDQTIARLLAENAFLVKQVGELKSELEQQRELLREERMGEDS